MGEEETEDWLRLHLVNGVPLKQRQQSQSINLTTDLMLAKFLLQVKMCLRVVAN